MENVKNGLGTSMEKVLNFSSFQNFVQTFICLFEDQKMAKHVILHRQELP